MLWREGSQRSCTGILGRTKGELSALFQVGVIPVGQRGAGLWDFPGLLCVFKCKPVRKRVCGGVEIGVLFLLLFIYYLCVCVYMEVRGQLLGANSVILLFVLGIEVRSPGLAASGFTP